MLVFLVAIATIISTLLFFAFVAVAIRDWKETGEVGDGQSLFLFSVSGFYSACGIYSVCQHYFPKLPHLVPMRFNMSPDQYPVLTYAGNTLIVLATSILAALTLAGCAKALLYASRQIHQMKDDGRAANIKAVSDDALLKAAKGNQMTAELNLLKLTQETKEKAKVVKDPNSASSIIPSSVVIEDLVNTSAKVIKDA